LFNKFLRPELWACLLGVVGNPKLEYETYNLDAALDIDRQLDLDIPRCHQYHPLLSSPGGRQKLKRILKAWTLCERGNQVYWQGLDSLCAPFLVLHYENEAKAYACMKMFTRKYCRGFFSNDNSFVMREYVQCFRTLLAFHEPTLSLHLTSIGLGPELFVISWFMTLFARMVS
jgi:TBC domain-containing protein kinase-like protein